MEVFWFVGDSGFSPQWQTTDEPGLLGLPLGAYVVIPDVRGAVVDYQRVVDVSPTGPTLQRGGPVNFGVCLPPGFVKRHIDRVFIHESRLHAGEFYMEAFPSEDDGLEIRLKKK